MKTFTKLAAVILPSLIATQAMAVNVRLTCTDRTGAPRANVIVKMNEAFYEGMKLQDLFDKNGNVRSQLQPALVSANVDKVLGSRAPEKVVEITENVDSGVYTDVMVDLITSPAGEPDWGGGGIRLFASALQIGIRYDSRQKQTKYIGLRPSGSETAGVIEEHSDGSVDSSTAVICVMEYKK